MAAFCKTCHKQWNRACGIHKGLVKCDRLKSAIKGVTPKKTKTNTSISTASSGASIDDDNDDGVVSVELAL